MSLNIQNICAVVITYNPGDDFLKNISAISKQVNQIIIIDNSSANKNFIREIRRMHPSIILVENATNIGIAGALNIGVKTAIRLQFHWALQLDQDSLLNANMIEVVCKTFLSTDLSRTAMIGVNYSNGGKNMLKNSRKEIIEVSTLITSGSFINTEVFVKAGDYRSDFFIDAVDFEYSLRLRKQQYQLLLVTQPLMSHAIGELKTLNLGLFKLHSTNHNALRRYYRARNTMLLTRMYFTSFPGWILKYLFFFMLSILLIILVDNNKGDKLKSILKGLKDGIFAKRK